MLNFNKRQQFEIDGKSLQLLLSLTIFFFQKFTDNLERLNITIIIELQQQQNKFERTLKLFLLHSMFYRS